LVTVSLCEWQADFDFFTSPAKPKSTDGIPCEEAFLERGVRVSEGQAGIVTPVEASEFEAELRKIVAGYPIEAMASLIAQYDRNIAGLIVGIGKKESNWGKRVPRTDEGEDCFNYWGYTGAGTRGVAMGHGCFSDAAEAVRVVGNRLQALVTLRKTSEPAQLTIWKCGSSCAGHSSESVRKWVSDVDLYFRAIARK
jgi:hypothetical protein